jgi:hypothetical protein
VLALLLAASSARADDPAAAQASFDEGKRLMGAGRYTEACLAFDQSQRADPGLGTQFHLADCWQHIGRLASAWSLFHEIESQARVRGEGARERVAHDRAAALESFVPKVLVDPHGASGTPGLSIRRDGAEMPREQWGVPVPTDAGSHTIAVYAPGKQPWGTGFEVPLNGGGVVTIDVPPLSDLADLPSVATAPRVAPLAPIVAASAGAEHDGRGVTSAMPDSPPAMEEPAVENHGGAQKAAGWALVGAGIAGLGAGAYFTTQWANDRHQSNSHCLGSLCDSTGSQQRHDAATQGVAAIIAGGSGLAAAIIGAALAATAPEPRAVNRPAARLEIVPLVDAHQGGLGLNGVW